LGLVLGVRGSVLVAESWRGTRPLRILTPSPQPLLPLEVRVSRRLPGRSAPAALALLLLAAPAALHAQASNAAGAERGGFVVMLGRDTIMVERFTRTAQRLEGDVLARSPRARLTHYTATLGTGGRVTHYESETRMLAPTPRGPRGGKAILDLGADSARVQLVLGDSTRRYTVGGPAPLIPMPGSFSWTLFDQAIRAARYVRVPAGDSVPVTLVMPGQPEATASSVRPLAQDSVVVGFFGLPAYAKLDEQGRLLRWNGMQTTDKFMVTRVGNVDVDRLAAAWAKADSSGKTMGELSPRDTVRATAGGAALTIDYGRPHVRGRKIFGNIVPLDTVWRLGANAATGFTTTKDLVMGGVTVPAGSYTLFALPSANSAKLIVSKATGEWGTDYDPTKDLARIDLEAGKPTAPIEQFTITVYPTPNGGVLRFAWENTEWRMPFVVR
jgi:hypothetical protein